LSTEEQAAEGKGGLLRQQEEIRIAAQRWNLEISKSYRIIDVSGTQVSESSEFRDLLETLKQPSVNGLVVAAIDRLMRPDDFSSFSVYDFFAKNHRYIWTPSSQIDVAEDSGFLEALVQGMMAGLDRRRILRNTQVAKEEKRKLGRCANAKITLPNGVNFDFVTGKWSFVEPYASRVREAFGLFLTGNYSIRHIAKILGYKSARTLYNHLRNPIWCGIREYRYRRGSEKYPSQNGRQSDRKRVLRDEPLIVKLGMEPLISEEDFQKAQELLETRRGEWKSARSKGSRFEATGLLYCHCGQRMYSKSARRSEGHDSYYCRSKHACKGCGSPSVKRETIDFTISSFVSDYFLKPAAMELLLKSVNERKDSGRLTANIERARAEIEQLGAKKRRLLSLAVSGAFSPEEIECEAKCIDADTTAWNATLRKAERDLAAMTIANSRNLALAIASVFAEFQHLQPSERKLLLRRFVSRVDISGDSITGIRMQIPDMSTKMCTRTGRGSWRRPA